MRSCGSGDLRRNMLDRLCSSLATVEGVVPSSTSYLSLEAGSLYGVAGVEALECVLLVDGCLPAILLLLPPILEPMPGYSSSAVSSSRLVGVELGSTDTTDFTGNTRSVMDEPKSSKGGDMLVKKGETAVAVRCS